MFCATPYLALQKMVDQLLHALSLSEKPLFDVQPLQPALSAAHVVHPCGAVFYRPM